MSFHMTEFHVTNRNFKLIAVLLLNFVLLAVVLFFVARRRSAFSCKNGDANSSPFFERRFEKFGAVSETHCHFALWLRPSVSSDEHRCIFCSVPFGEKQKVFSFSNLEPLEMRSGSKKFACVSCLFLTPKSALLPNFFCVDDCFLALQSMNGVDVSYFAFLLAYAALSDASCLPFADALLYARHAALPAKRLPVSEALRCIAECPEARDCAVLHFKLLMFFLVTADVSDAAKRAALDAMAETEPPLALFAFDAVIRPMAHPVYENLLAIYAFDAATAKQADARLSVFLRLNLARVFLKNCFVDAKTFFEADFEHPPVALNAARANRQHPVIKGNNIEEMAANLAAAKDFVRDVMQFYEALGAQPDGLLLRLVFQRFACQIIMSFDAAESEFPGLLQLANLA